MTQDIFEKMTNSTKSLAMKIVNAERKKLRGLARQVYLEGYASLSKCEKFAERGNAGRGFYIAKIVNPEMADKLKEKDEKKTRRKKQKKKSSK